MPIPISGIADSVLKTHARVIFLIREIISSTPPFIAFGRPQTRGFNHLQTCSVGLYSGEYVLKSGDYDNHVMRGQGYQAI